MPGFYIASYPTTPYRYEVGYTDLRTLMNSDAEISVHLYLENEIQNAELIIKEIMELFIEFHDITSVPGTILLNLPLSKLVLHIFTYAEEKTVSLITAKKWWFW